MTTTEVKKKLKHLKWQSFATGILFWGGLIWMFYRMVGLRDSGRDAVSELMPQFVLMGLGFVWYLYVRIRFWMLNEE